MATYEYRTVNGTEVSLTSDGGIDPTKESESIYLFAEGVPGRISRNPRTINWFLRIGADADSSGYLLKEFLSPDDKGSIVHFAEIEDALAEFVKIATSNRAL